jgi:hypothetical protein
MTAPDLFNEKDSFDIQHHPYKDIEGLVLFIQLKTHSSEEFANRRRADEMLGARKVGSYRPKAVTGEPVIEILSGTSILTTCRSNLPLLFFSGGQ